MQADWEFEIGPGAPVMDAHWPDYVDLTAHPEQAAHLPEAAQFPPLAETLQRLNTPASAIWTSKSDLWRIDLSENPLDPFEMDAPSDALAAAHACYIDILVRPPRLWRQPGEAQQFCRNLCAVLQAVPLRGSRIDLVIRRAVFAHGEGIGITAYLTACGASEEAARQALGHALAAFADSIFAI